MSGRDILRFFSPRWFIAIMGTGAVANILQLMDRGADGYLHGLAVALLTASVLAFPLALALLLGRLFIDRKMLWRELEHSSLVQFYSAIFIAASVCVTGLMKIPLGFVSPETVMGIAKVLWFISLGFGLVLVVFTHWRIITLNHGEIRRILGFWFLPPVGLFVLVFAGNFLALKTGDSGWIEPMAVLNAFLLGAALFLSLMLFPKFLLRGLAFPFPPRMDVIPSFTIGLAPVGVSIIALLSYLPLMSQAEALAFAPLAVIGPIVKALTVLLWGFGFWWLLVTALITLTTFLRKGVPVTLGYWAFIFPPAVYTIATLFLAQATKISFLAQTWTVLSWVVSIGWLVVMLLTLRGVINRSIFNLPPSFEEILEDSADASVPHAQLAKEQFKNKFPIFRVDIQKSEKYPEASILVEVLKTKISNHPVARHIADFDHYLHTKNIEGGMPKELLGAIVIMFCFGPQIEEARVLAVRPRSIGLAEFENHFTITFMEAPSEKATDTMKEWIQSL
ncbi:MAG: DUF6858 family protein [Opitutales bacterium]